MRDAGRARRECRRHEVDGDGEQQDRDAGNRRRHGARQRSGCGLAQHPAEVGLRRLRAEAEETQARGLQDHPADRGRKGDDDGGQTFGGAPQ